MMVSITMNKADLKRVERMTEGFRRGAEKVLSRAINTVTTRARKKVQQFVQKLTGLKQKETRIWKISGKRRATNRRLEAILGISAFRPSLSAFASVQTNRGVTRRAGRAGRRLIVGAFKLAQKGQRRAEVEPASVAVGVFKRAGKARTPLVKLKGPSSAQLYEDDDAFAQRVETGIGNDMLRQTDKEIQWLLETGK